MSENMNDESIVLLNEDGEEKEFFIEEQFEFEGNLYYVLYETEESEDAFLYKACEDEEGEIYLQEVEDDEEFDRVSEFYSEE